MLNFGLLAAEIGSGREFGAPLRISTGFVALLHGTLVVGVSQTLRGVEQSAPPIFGRAAITLGIGPHPSYGRPM